MEYPNANRKQSNNNNPKYAPQPSSEALQPPSSIERSVRRAQLSQDQSPYWEWDIEQGEFVTKDLWQNLTGHDTFAVFPSIKKGTSPSHDQLVELIDRWALIIYEPDRIEACDRAREFLLGSPENKTFKLAYRIETADKSIVTVESTAMTLWKDKKLVSIFCETRDLTEYATLPLAAAAIAHNSDKIKSFDAKLEPLTQNLDAVLKMLKSISGFSPLIVGLILFAGDGFVLAVNQFHRVRDAIFNPVQTAITSRSFDEGLLPIWFTPETLPNALAELEPLGRFGVATLYAYDPGNYPAQYTPLLEATAAEKVLFAEGTSPYLTSDSPEVSERTRQHLSGQVYLGALDGVFSIPFKVIRSDGREQTFFVQVESSGKLGPVSSQENLAEAIKVTEEIKKVINKKPEGQGKV